jgi:hypothetical protein
MSGVFTIRRRAAAVLVVVATALVGAHPAFAAEGGGADNVVQVKNVVDGALQARANLSLAHDSAPIVQNQNIAIAESSCSGCRSVAVAEQAVIVDGAVSDFEPANAAVATNDGCLDCETLAYARQDILVSDHVVVLGADAQAQILDLEDQMQAIAASDEAFDQMTVDLDSLAQQVVSILQTAIEQGGPAGQLTTHRQVDHHED